MTDIDTARTVYGMHKQANPLAYIVLGGKMLTSGLGFGGALLLAAASGMGMATGWSLSQLTAHNRASVDTAKKEYMRQRLNADIASLGGKINAEAGDIENEQEKKPARVLGV